jgi:hypothetical protein
MANKKVGIFVRVNEKGKQKTLKAEWIGNARLKTVPGGVYWLKWLQGTQQNITGLARTQTTRLLANYAKNGCLLARIHPKRQGSPIGKGCLTR